MRKTSCKAKTLSGDFNHSQKSANQQSSGYKYKKFYQLPLPIPKYQLTVEPSLQYPVELDHVVVFFPLMHKSPICD